MPFTADTLKFLRDVAKHNDRAWFAKNKPRYETHVKAPADAFAAEVAAKLGMRPHVMRIYRDTRFSKDKSPYKTNIGIGFSRGTFESDGPGYYLHVEPGASFAGVGMWRPQPPALLRIREAIASDEVGWLKVHKIGLDDDEDALKRTPRGFDPDHRFAEDLKRKSFTASIEFTDAHVAKADFPKRYVAAAKKLAPLGAFLADATGTPW